MSPSLHSPTLVNDKITKALPIAILVFLSHLVPPPESVIFESDSSQSHPQRFFDEISTKMSLNVEQPFFQVGAVGVATECWDGVDSTDMGLLLKNSNLLRAH